MEQATRNNSRPGIRLLLGLIAVILFAYCVEIIVMGAPDFRKHSDRTYYRDKDPVPFWTQFSLFAAAGATAAYFAINWRKGLPLIESIDKRDRERLAAMGPAHAKAVHRKRELQAVVYFVAAALIAGLLASLLIQ